MLFESKKIRDLLNYSTVTRVTTPSNSPAISTPGHQVPKNYGMSYNPIPALVFFILGVMMSKHHQALPLSTTLHTQVRTPSLIDGCNGSLANPNPVGNTFIRVLGL